MAPANFASTLIEAQSPAATVSALPVHSAVSALIGHEGHDAAHHDRRRADHGAIRYVIRNDLV